MIERSERDRMRERKVEGESQKEKSSTSIPHKISRKAIW
jgi:hypothetical protein